MDSRPFRHLLVRVLLVPVAALAVLAILLGTALRQVMETARWVDRSDRVIATAYDLSSLLVDQETGLRGYLVTKDRSFLEPYIASDSRIEARFDALLSQLADNPDQGAAVRQIRLDYQRWRQQQAPILTTFPKPADVPPTLMRQKAGMDHMRGEWHTFLAQENVLRSQRNDWASRVDSLTLFAIIFLSAAFLGIILFSTARTFLRLSRLYQNKLDGLEVARRDVHQRQQWLQTTLRSIGDAVIACDAEGNITFINTIAEQLTGWNEFEAVGQPVSRVFVVVHESTRLPAESPVDTARTLGIVAGLDEHILLVRKDLSEIAIDDSAAPIRDPDGELLGAVLVFRDVTGKRLADQALMRAERLAAAGRLSASIAHEVNNPLEGLMNLLYIARRLDNLAETQNLIEKAELEVGRVAHITRQALGFYQDTTALSEFSLSEVVKQVVSFYASRAALDHIQLESRIADGVNLNGSSGEVQQVLSNLLANSLDATPPHGKIRITVRRTRELGGAGREGVNIFVADTGCGINRDGMARMFEAFYTTKEKTGTGLGLWVTKQLAEKHGGSLRVRSRADGPKTGTVFKIFLPAVSALINPAPQKVIGARH
jgi:PAS domain S-box-containing protein